MSNRIFTHAGQFHADEVLAIALIHEVVGELPIIRTFNPEPEEGDWVVDIGMEFDTSRLRFDHHQDEAIGASNMLVLRFLHRKGCISPEAAEALRTRLFERVSDIDCGRAKPVEYEYNSLIRAFNGTRNGFEEALGFSRRVVSNIIRDAEKQAEDKKRYYACPIVGRARVCEDSDPILGWKEVALEELLDDQVVFLVTPNARGGWQAISADSERWNIPADPRQTFRHATGFLAVYATKEDCLGHLSELKLDIPSRGWEYCDACLGVGHHLVSGDECGYCLGAGTVGTA